MRGVYAGAGVQTTVLMREFGRDGGRGGLPGRPSAGSDPRPSTAEPPVRAALATLLALVTSPVLAAHDVILVLDASGSTGGTIGERCTIEIVRKHAALDRLRVGDRPATRDLDEERHPAACSEMHLSAPAEAGE